MGRLRPRPCTGSESTRSRPRGRVRRPRRRGKPERPPMHGFTPFAPQGDQRDDAEHGASGCCPGARVPSPGRPDHGSRMAAAILKAARFSAGPASSSTSRLRRCWGRPTCSHRQPHQAGIAWSFIIPARHGVPRGTTPGPPSSCSPAALARCLRVGQEFVADLAILVIAARASRRPCASPVTIVLFDTAHVASVPQVHDTRSR